MNPGRGFVKRFRAVIEGLGAVRERRIRRKRFS
jgi:hypothetical protein